MDQEQFNNVISSHQKTITITVNQGTENEETRSFITNKFKTMEGLEVSLIVHKEILSLLPTDITQGFDVRALNPAQFSDSLIKLFSKTYTKDTNQICSNLDDAFKGKNAYSFLMPLALEVIEFNGFFTLLGLENTFHTTLEKIKSQMLLMQILNELETSDNNLKSLQILNQEQTQEDPTSGTSQTNSEENKTKKTKKSKESLKTS